MQKNKKENPGPIYLTKTDVKFLNILVNLFQWFVRRIKHDDQMKVITEIQILFNIQKLISVIHHVHTVKNKIISSLDAEKHLTNLSTNKKKKELP